MMGLDAAGKTTTLYKLKLGDVISSPPTFGFNVETINYKNLKFVVWDVGGGYRIKDMVEQCLYKDTHGLIFVVDSADRDRIDIAKEELDRILGSILLKEMPLLVFANKVDLNVMSVTEVAEKLDLPLLKDRKWQIQGCSALKGEGLYDGLDWLAKALSPAKN